MSPGSGGTSIGSEEEPPLLPLPVRTPTLLLLSLLPLLLLLLQLISAPLALLAPPHGAPTRAVDALDKRTAYHKQCFKRWDQEASDALSMRTEEASFFCMMKGHTYCRLDQSFRT